MHKAGALGIPLPTPLPCGGTLCRSRGCGVTPSRAVPRPQGGFLQQRPCGQPVDGNLNPCRRVPHPVFTEQKQAQGTGLHLLFVSQTSCGLQARDPDSESTERHCCRPPRVTVGFPRRDPRVRSRGEAHRHRGDGSAALPPRCRRVIESSRLMSTEFSMQKLRARKGDRRTLRQRVFQAT